MSTAGAGILRTLVSLGGVIHLIGFSIRTYLITGAQVSFTGFLGFFPILTNHHLQNPLNASRVEHRLGEKVERRIMALCIYKTMTMSFQGATELSQIV